MTGNHQVADDRFATERVGADPGGVEPEPLDELIQRIACRDETALAAFYNATVSRLFALGKAILGNDADAEDMVSDVYTQVWQTAARFDSSRGSALAWVLTIGRNRSIDVLRQRRAFTRRHAPEAAAGRAATASEEPSAEERLHLFQRETAVQAALESLTPVQRQVLSLAFLQGLSHQETAAASGLPLGTVKSHLRRSLAMLRATLDVGTT